MTINANKVDTSTVVLTLSGRLDTANASMLERRIKQWGDEIAELILDFTELEYISSMGLRVLLQAQKTMKEKKRRLVIKNLCQSVREVFEMTGFLNLMVEEEKFVVVCRDEPGAVVLSLNGEMRVENIPIVSKELAEIKNHKKSKTVKVILDMEKLSDASTTALKHLNQAIEETAWGGRKLVIRNASADVRDALDDLGLGELLEEAGKGQ